MANIIAFAVFAVVIVCAALASVFTRSVMRSVTALLFVLFAVAGMYFLLDYTFIGAAQISIYAGGITMIYIFAIQLTSKRTLQGLAENVNLKRFVMGGIIALVGLLTVIGVMLKTQFLGNLQTIPDMEVPMEQIGTALVGGGKYQYILPFEFISLFLLACIIGGLAVARNHQKEEE